MPIWWDQNPFSESLFDGLSNAPTSRNVACLVRPQARLQVCSNTHAKKTHNWRKRCPGWLRCRFGGIETHFLNLCLMVFPTHLLPEMSHVWFVLRLDYKVGASCRERKQISVGEEALEKSDADLVGSKPIF